MFLRSTTIIQHHLQNLDRIRPQMPWHIVACWNVSYVVLCPVYSSNNLLALLDAVHTRSSLDAFELSDDEDGDIHVRRDLGEHVLLVRFKRDLTSANQC
jgi:hypothetical protein